MMTMRPSRRSFGSVAIPLAAIASSGVAASVAAQPADDKAVTLEWIAPAAECPDAAYVERELARLLAGDPVAAERRLRARAEVHGEGGKWRVRIRTSGVGGSGDRSLDAESCRALADATALIVALAVDPARVAANRAAASAPSASSAATPSASTSASAAPSTSASAPPTASSSPATIPVPSPTASSIPTSSTTTQTRSPPPPDSPSPPTRFAFAVGGVLDTATLPHTTGGGAASFTIAPGFVSPLRLEANAALFLGASTGTGTPRGGDFAFRAFGLGLCLPLERNGWDLAPCLGAELAWIVAHGDGPSAPDSGSALMPRLRAGGAFAVRLAEPVYLRADLALMGALSRPEFVVGGVGGGPVHKPAALSARAGLGIEVRF